MFRKVSVLIVSTFAIVISMKKLLPISFLFFLGACATSVNVDYKKDINFTQYRTFFLQGEPVNITKDTRIDTPFVKERVIQAIGDNLTAKGFTVSQPTPDITVKYHLVIKQEIETDDSGVTFGFGTVSSHSFLGMSYDFPYRDISSYDNLVVTIDMFDTNNILLWRGSLGRRLYDGSTPESNTELINGLVSDILEQFPPK